MKSIRFLTLLFLISASPASFNKVKAQSAEINFSVFQSGLSPYGRWFNNPRFGQVWVYNDPGFRPYATDGHWEYTNFGWNWVSDFDWGWAPFHYGRWEYDPFYGWMWIPGYEWASAWVSWSQYDGYYGWAPLGFGAAVNISFGAVPYDRWNFLPRRYMGSRDFYRHCAPPRNNYFRNSVTINNYYEGREGRFTRGPERHEVERFTNNRIEERHIDYNGRPGNNYNGSNRYGVYTNKRGRNNNDGSNSNAVLNNHSNNNSSNADDHITGNNVPQNNPANNNRSDNHLPERSQQNFPGNRQNQRSNDNNPGRGNNRFERTYDNENMREGRPVQQDAERGGQYPQRNMQRRDQQPMQQQRTERRPAFNNERQVPQRNTGNHSSNRDEGRRQRRN
jgi:hypothetical protein